MGCRDCNSTLEACQNSLAAALEQNQRAATALVALGGLLDEHEDAVRAVVAPTQAAWDKTRGELSASFVEKVHEVVEEWILAEEEARG